MKYSELCMQRASVTNDQLVFDNNEGLHFAIKQELFLLKVPEFLNLYPGIKLCREFYHPTVSNSPCNAYSGFQTQTDIYFDRDNFQTEHLLLDRPRWVARLPIELVEMIRSMDALGQIVFQATLRKLNIPESLWGMVSGGAIAGQGTHWFAASHYRSERRLPGCAAHQDTGFVTLLYAQQPGLEAFVDGQA